MTAAWARRRHGRRHSDLRTVRIRTPYGCLAMLAGPLSIIICHLISAATTFAFIRPSTHCQLNGRGPMMRLHATAEPRTGLAQWLLDVALASPIWTHVLVPQARASIVRTAEENSIPWVLAKQFLMNQEDVPWKDPQRADEYRKIQYPEYYKKAFHAYSDGNLSYDAAFEQELASRAVGARNFPQYSSRGEDVFRGAFEEGLSKLGARIHRRSEHQNEVVIVDFGCGTGTSTRRLARQYPQATQLIGIDLSPYFIDVGRSLLKLAPSAIDTSGDCCNKDGWITTIDSDERIQLRQGDIANTQLPSDSVSAVNLSMVLHELPISAAKEVILEAHRILQPGGQMWISEMDFESPAYKAQRENALLFSLLRATEPYLDEYADGMRELRNFMADKFGAVKIKAATGRHYALVAEKSKGCLTEEDSKRHNVLEDYRFREDGSYSIDDTHLKPWESKLDSNTNDYEGDRQM